MCVLWAKALIWPYWPSSAPPEVFTSSWSWVCFHWPPDIQLNSGRMRCDVSSTGDAQCRRSASDSPRTPVSPNPHINGVWFLFFPSREQNGLSMLATANASLSAGWDDVYCCQSHTRSQRKWRCTPAVISDQEKLAANYLFKNVVPQPDCENCLPVVSLTWSVRSSRLPPDPVWNLIWNITMLCVHRPANLKRNILVRSFSTSKAF